MNAEKWKGPWKCEKCELSWHRSYSPSGEYICTCGGKLIPYDRRASFGTYLSSANRRTENEARPIDQRDLALAQMRDALEDARVTVDSGLHQCFMDKDTPLRFQAFMGALHDLCYERLDKSLAASPADGLCRNCGDKGCVACDARWEEVRWLLAHSSGNFPHVHPGNYEGWTTRRDVLLSRLGGAEDRRCSMPDGPVAGTKEVPHEGSDEG